MKQLLSIIVGVVVAVSFGQVVNAYELTLEDFTGSEATAVLSIEGDGTTEVSISVSLVNTIGDIRGVFLGLEGLIPSDLLVDGVDVTSVTTNVTFHPSLEDFDYGIEIGTEGIGLDDIASTMFSLTSSENIYLSDMFAARVTSVGEDREGSSKLLVSGAYVPPIPEPGTIALMGLGLLIGLAGVSRKNRARRS